MSVSHLPHLTPNYNCCNIIRFSVCLPGLLSLMEPFSINFAIRGLSVFVVTVTVLLNSFVSVWLTISSALFLSPLLCLLQTFFFCIQYLVEDSLEGVLKVKALYLTPHHFVISFYSLYNFKMYTLRFSSLIKLLNINLL